MEFASTGLNKNIYHYINLNLLSESIHNPLIERISSVALPFLNLYQPSAQVLLFGTAGIKGAIQLKLTVVCLFHQNWRGSILSFTALAATICTLAANIFAYRLGLIVGLSSEIYMQLKAIGSAFNQRNYHEFGKSFLKLTQSTLYLTSVIIPNPSLMIVSTIMQIAAEGFNAHKQLKNGRYIEGISLIILTGIRGVRLKNQLEEYLNPIGGSPPQPIDLTEDETQQLLIDFQNYRNLADTNQTIQFGDFLKNKGYPLHLQNINFKETLNPYIESNIFKNVDFKNVSFSNCEFNSTNFTSTNFINSTLSNCTFNNVELSHSTIKNSLILSSNFKTTDLSHAKFENVKIECSLFKDSKIENAIFNKTWFNQTAIKSSFLTHSSFNNCHFKSCNFALSYFTSVWFGNTNFEEISLNVEDQLDVSIGDFNLANFQSCYISNSSFANANFKDSKWKASTIRDSDFSDSIFSFSKIAQTTFKNVNLNFVTFYNTLFDYNYLFQCSLSGAAFLKAQASKTLVMSCDLTNCLFFDRASQFQFHHCTQNLITSPIVGLSQIHGFRGFNTREIYKGIKKGGAIPVRLDNQVQGIDEEKLKLEISCALEQAIKNQNDPNFYSLPDEILKLAQPGSEISKIKLQAVDFVKHMNGILIPGGSDIEPFFYNKETEYKTLVEGDNGRRTLFEFALCKEAHKNQCPLIGICRGAQIGALYHGAPSLNQDVPNQFGVIQDFTIKGSRLQEIMGDSIRVISMHHQSVESPGPNLIATIETETIMNDQPLKVIKALEHPNGLVFLLQFHPEYGFTSRSDQITPNNINAFYALKDLADIYKLASHKEEIEKNLKDTALKENLKTTLLAI